MKFYGGLPENCMVRLEYNERYQMSGAANSYTDWTFYPKWPYDPSNSVGNDSAAYWSFWKQVYQYYHVNYCTIDITLLDINANDAYAHGTVATGVYLASTTPSSNLDVFTAHPWCHNAFETSNGYRDNKEYHIKDAFSPFQVLGRQYQPSLDNTPTDSTTPNENLAYVVRIVSNTGEIAYFNARVKIVYYCTFSKFVPNTPIGG